MSPASRKQCLEFVGYLILNFRFGREARRIIAHIVNGRTILLAGPWADPNRATSSLHVLQFRMFDRGEDFCRWHAPVIPTLPASTIFFHPDLREIICPGHSER